MNFFLYSSFVCILDQRAKTSKLVKTLLLSFDSVEFSQFLNTKNNPFSGVAISFYPHEKKLFPLRNFYVRVLNVWI